MKRLLGTTLLMTACGLLTATTTRPAKAYGAISRFLNDGSADPAFSGLGTGRRVYDPPDSEITSIARWGAKLYVIGDSTSGAPRFLARLNSDGTPDTTFGFAGVTTGSFSTIGGTESWRALVVQNTGRVVILGGTISDPYLVRYNTDGSLDLNFGTQGRVRPYSISVEGAAMTADIDGKLYVASAAISSHPEIRPQLARIAPFGEVERTVNQSTCSSDQELFTTHVLTDTSRRATVIGLRRDRLLHIARYTAPDLFLDTSFSRGGGAGCTAGVFATPSGQPSGIAATLDGQGRTVVALGRDSTIDFFRLRNDGTMDTWQGTYSFPEAASQVVLTKKIWITPSGAYMITGSAVFRGTSRTFAVKLLATSPDADTTYGWGGYRHLTFNPYEVIATDSLLDPLERIVITGLGF